MTVATHETTPSWERALRLKLAFICMAAVAGKEGDLRHLTQDAVNFVRDLKPSEVK